MNNFYDIYSIDSNSFLDETIDFKHYKLEYAQNLKLLKLESRAREKEKVPCFLRRKNYYILITVTVLLLISLICISVYSINETTKREIHETSVNIILEDNYINPEEYTVTVDSRVYFSIEKLCEQLGISYEEIDESRYKIITEDNSYYLKKNSSDMKIESNETGKIDSNLTLSKKVFVHNDCMYIYVRDLSLFMPVITKWNAENNTVYIKSYL